MARLALAMALPLALVLFAGCTADDGASNLTPAQMTQSVQAAQTNFEKAGSPTGDLKAMRATMQMSMGSQMSMSMRMDATLLQGGAFDVRIAYESMRMEGESMPDLSGVTFRMVCLPDRIVVVTTGFAKMGNSAKDVSAETPNSARTCDSSDPMKAQMLEADVRRLAEDAFGDGMEALGDTSMGMASGFHDPTGDMDLPRPTKVEASGDDLVAHYDFTEHGMKMTGTQTVRGQRIVAMAITMTMDLSGMAAAMGAPEGSQGSMTMTSMITANFDYGTRTAAPDVHGTQKVPAA